MIYFILFFGGRFSLFRQLCALHWLLEAMNLDPHQAMTPITTSWYLGYVLLPINVTYLFCKDITIKPFMKDTCNERQSIFLHHNLWLYYIWL